MTGLAPFRTGAQRVWLVTAGLVLPAATAMAGTVGQIDGFDIRWDTTIRLSIGLRIEPAEPALLGNINADDGDRAFGPGFESERADVITEITGERGLLGFDVSAQGWYDAAYNTDSSNNSPATFNPLTSGHRGFPGDVRDLMGRDAELLNAYARDTLQLGATPITISLGRQTLLWGESLLFPENGIAAAQAPVDEIKALGSPLAEAREVYLPVTQIVLRAGLGGGLSMEAYDQFEWRPDREPGVGSFLSTSDFLGAGGQRYLAAGGLPTMYRTADDTPHGLGQFGFALRQSDASLDWGVYALRAEARVPGVVFDPGYRAYTLIYSRGIQIYGASISTYAGDANVAGEISLHRDTPLDAAASPGAPGSPATGYGGGYAASANRTALTMPPAMTVQDYAMPAAPIVLGSTINAQASVQAQMPPGHLADGASLQGELAANGLVTPRVPAGRTRFALAARAVFTPQYFHVLPGLDLALPVGLGLGLAGRSAIDGSQNAGAGFINGGLLATFHVVWQGALNVTHFVGGAGQQKLADRDFVTLSVTRSF